MKLRGNPRLKSLDRKVLGALIWILQPLKRKLEIPSPPRRVLLIRLNALGDTLLFQSLARLLKDRFPGVRVDFLGSEINKSVIERCRHLDRIHILELSDLPRRPHRLFSLLRRIRQINYDVVIDGSQWEHLSAFIALLSGSAAAIGFRTPGHERRAAAFHIPIPHRRENHEIDCFLALVEPLGISADPQDRRGDYQVAPGDRERLEQIQLPPAPWIVMHPGTGHRNFRQWPAGSYRRLIDRLGDAFPDYNVILTGHGVEEKLCEEIRSGVFRRIYSLANRLDFHLLGALLEKASLLVCGNTGVMHLGATLDIPLIALHGPAGSRRWGPLSARSVVLDSPKVCAPCLYLGYEYNCQCPSCMEEIRVEDVYHACENILTGHAARVRHGA